MQLIPWMSKRVRSYIYLNLKFHDNSNFFTAFDIATYRHVQYAIVQLVKVHTVSSEVSLTTVWDNYKEYNSRSCNYNSIIIIVILGSYWNLLFMSYNKILRYSSQAADINCVIFIL